MDSEFDMAAERTWKGDHLLESSASTSNRDSTSFEKQDDKYKQPAIDVVEQYQSTITHLQTLLKGLIDLKNQVAHEVLRHVARWLADAAATLALWTVDLEPETFKSPLFLDPDLQSLISIAFENIKASSCDVIRMLQSSGEFDPPKQMSQALQTLRDSIEAIQMQVALKYQRGPLQSLNSFIGALAQHHLERLDVNDAEALPYEYNPIETNQIRLFRLLPHDENKPICGYIDTYDLTLPHTNFEVNANPDLLTNSSITLSDDTMPEYSTLSYYWGDSPATEDIFVLTDPRHGIFSKLKITQNLAEALRELRKSIQSDGLKLWINAICIDQRNISERNTPVAYMVNVFSRASLTYVWLGTESAGSSLAINYVKQMSNIEDFTRDLKNGADSFHPAMEAFRHLIGRGWFRRPRAVQELCLSKDAIVVCGKDRLTWEKLEEAISLLVARKS